MVAECIYFSISLKKAFSKSYIYMDRIRFNGLWYLISAALPGRNKPAITDQ